MDVKKHDHRKAYIAPAAASVIVVLFIGIILFAMIAESMREHLSTGEFLLIAAVTALLLAIVIGILLALWQRIKQIKGGEEDAASKY